MVSPTTSEVGVPRAQGRARIRPACAYYVRRHARLCHTGLLYYLHVRSCSRVEIRVESPRGSHHTNSESEIRCLF